MAGNTMQRPTPNAATMLDAESARFIRGGRSTILAGRGDDGVPAIVRAQGTRVAADLCTVVVFVARSQAADLLRGVAANATLAAVWSEPRTNRTVQFKGRDARVVPLAAGDLVLVADHGAAFAAEITALGYPARLPAALHAVEPDDLVAIAFTPSEGFAQTPGPNAGARLARPR